MIQEEMLSQMEMMLQPLQQANASQAETIKKLTEQNESLQSRIKELTAQVAWLNRQLFGRKSEKLHIIDPNCPDLFAGMLPENAPQIADAHDAAVEKIVTTKEVRRQEKKNRIMMEDLPVLEQVILTPDNLDGNLYRKIGQEVTRIVEHKPGQLYIKEIIREKWGAEGQHLCGSGEYGWCADCPDAPAAYLQGNRRSQPAGRDPAAEVRVPYALLPPDQTVQPPWHEGADGKHRGRLVQADDRAAQATLRGAQVRSDESRLCTG